MDAPGRPLTDKLHRPPGALHLPCMSDARTQLALSCQSRGQPCRELLTWRTANDRCEVHGRWSGWTARSGGSILP